MNAFVEVTTAGTTLVSNVVCAIAHNSAWSNTVLLGLSVVTSTFNYLVSLGSHSLSAVAPDAYFEGSKA